ncbi:DnaJ domain-containing protein [Nodosilinea sp. LEGE 07298]|uniref:J domain-containing protein n=1 Tax=Nodosilinea sp. LEGE 07298 TaxID=2777970 RepID=UPI0018817A4C|nr:J domain-containing protein [Nodosilinea sp. LEGE 07298]MBE9110940.1 DnaJ domain-containing protein [Nodosilinea sp. LEGE 07298]
MKPDQGLFQSDFDDHHAVLGVPISADAKVVRKRYLTIARKLHPDSLSGASAAEAQQASEVLSKLVNPAYEALSQEKSSTEHGLILKLKGQTLRRTGTAPAVTSTAAQDLLKAPHIDAAYRQAVNGLAAQQFDQLEAISEVIGSLSELNLVYLYRSTASDRTSASSATASTRTAATRSQSASANSAAPPSPRQNQAAILDSYVNRAQEYELNKDYSRAILELREAIKTYPNDGTCHSYLSTLYLKAGQGTMARIHAKRALEINPNDERAKAVQARVDKSSGAASSGAQSANAKASNLKSAAKGSPDKGGGFFGLFGGKKK